MSYKVIRYVVGNVDVTSVSFLPFLLELAIGWIVIGTAKEWLAKHERR